MADDAGRSPHLEHLRWLRRPQLYAPVMLIAFSGWGDAGDAATTAVRHLGDQWNARPFATIDPEEFYDFSATRPRVELDDNDDRQIVWPENELSAATVPGTSIDVITLIGVEPQLRWRTFCEQVTGLAQLFDTKLVVTCGALLAEVPHSRPVSIFGAGYDDEVIAELDLLPSRYEGPTGITGVLHNACHQAGLRSASLWAAVPTYVPSAPSPKAALALIERAGRLLEVAVEAADLEVATASYEAQVSELVGEDDETTDYVRQLEERYDADESELFDDGGESLVQEVERFLRDQD